MRPWLLPHPLGLDLCFPTHPRRTSEDGPQVQESTSETDCPQPIPSRPHPGPASSLHMTHKFSRLNKHILWGLGTLPSLTVPTFPCPTLARPAPQHRTSLGPPSPILKFPSTSYPSPPTPATRRVESFFSYQPFYCPLLPGYTVIGNRTLARTGWSYQFAVDSLLDRGKGSPQWGPRRQVRGVQTRGGQKGPPKEGKGARKEPTERLVQWSRGESRRKCWLDQRHQERFRHQRSAQPRHREPAWRWPRDPLRKPPPAGALGGRPVLESGSSRSQRNLGGFLGAPLKLQCGPGLGWPPGARRWHSSLPEVWPEPAGKSHTTEKG